MFLGSKNVGSLTSHNPIGLHGLLRDSCTLLYLSFTGNEVEILLVLLPTFEEIFSVKCKTPFMVFRSIFSITENK
jgi:hypothetical protein